MKRLLIVVGSICLILVLVALLLPACGGGGDGGSETPTPAEFEVTSLDVEPTEVAPGETITVTAVVENSGGSQGTYNAVLTVDGTTAETKQVTLAAGASQTVTFSLVLDDAGSYEISVGGLSSSITVAVGLVATEVELKYDDGTYDGNWVFLNSGYLVGFSPPSATFTINTVKIYGNVYGTGYEALNFDVQIWDETLVEIYSASYPHTEFDPSPGWIEIDIPNVALTGDFYVCVVTHSPQEGGIQMYYDSSVVNEHSEMVLDGQIRDDWPIATPKEEVNWMIRVVGVAMLPGN